MERQLDVAVRVSRQAEAKQEMSRVWKHFEAGSKSASNASVRNIDAVVDRVKNISKAMQGATQDVEAFNKKFGDISQNARDLEFAHAFDGQTFRPNGRANVIMTGQSSGGAFENAAGKAGRIDTTLRSFDTLTNSISTTVNSFKNFDGSLSASQAILGNLSRTTSSVISNLSNLSELRGLRGDLKGTGTSVLGFGGALGKLATATTVTVGAVAAAGAVALFLHKKWTDEIAASEARENKIVAGSKSMGGWNEAILRNGDSLANLARIADAVRDRMAQLEIASKRTADRMGLEGKERAEFLAGQRQYHEDFFEEVASNLAARLDKFGYTVDKSGNLSKDESALGTVREDARKKAEEMAEKAARAEEKLEKEAKRASDIVEREQERSRKATERAQSAIERAAQKELDRRTSLSDMLKLPFSGPAPAAKGPGIFAPFGSVREQHDRFQSVGRAIAQGMLQGLRDGDKRTTHDVTRMFDGVTSVSW